jgi:hypothetical protein
MTPKSRLTISATVVIGHASTYSSIRNDFFLAIQSPDDDRPIGLQTGIQYTRLCVCLQRTQINGIENVLSCYEGT